MLPSYVYVLASAGFVLALLGTLAMVGLFDMPRQAPPPAAVPPPSFRRAAAAPARPEAGTTAPGAWVCRPLVRLPTGDAPQEVLVIIEDTPGEDGPTLLDLPVYQPEAPAMPPSSTPATLRSGDAWASAGRL